MVKMGLRWDLRISLFLLYCWYVVIGCWGQHLACDNRRPEGHVPVKSEGDGGFRVIVVGPQSTRSYYVPNEVYTVTIQGLKTRYSTQKFTESLLVAESEKQAMMGPTGLVTTGIFHIMDDAQTRFSDICPDGVTSINRQPKSEVSVLWTAPSILVASCITFKATVVERPHVWYMDQGLLTTTLCPVNIQENSTIGRTSSTTTTTTQPKTQRLRHYTSHAFARPINHEVSEEQRNQYQYQNQYHQLPLTTTTTTTTGNPGVGTEELDSDDGDSKCCACDEAKYEVVFEGIWGKETHPKDFPENEWLLHFSDIIGASHSPDYFVWKSGELASEGIRQVAEWGATRHLENELKAKSHSINTIIKARGLWHPNERGKTSAAFRVDRNHHLMSLVSMIGPSPDWLVGISGLELCLKNCTWLEETELDLFPFDAGTDSGITYMSPNTPTEPKERIRALTKSDPNDPRSPFYDPLGLNPLEPFAKVHIRRQRIYPKNCNDTSKTSETSHEVYLSENTEDVNRPECGVTSWTSWSSCSVTCGKGLRMRKRNYLLPMKADMMRCDRQLVEKEMCLGQTPTCPPEDGNFIEEIIDSICTVTGWSDWSPCSVSCGQGSKTRIRRYKNHLGRKKCNVETSQMETCRGFVEQCDPLMEISQVDCPMTPWSEWSPCSVSCGEGIQMRNRNFLILDGSTLGLDQCSNISLSEKADCTGEYGMDCKISMEEAKELCMLEAETGPCRASMLRFAFNPDKGICSPFTYGGCKGNRNRFETLQECKEVCGFLGNGRNSIVLPTLSPIIFANGRSALRQPLTQSPTPKTPPTPTTPPTPATTPTPTTPPTPAPAPQENLYKSTENIILNKEQYTISNSLDSDEIIFNLNLGQVSSPSSSTPQPPTNRPRPRPSKPTKKSRIVENWKESKTLSSTIPNRINEEGLSFGGGLGSLDLGQMIIDDPVIEPEEWKSPGIIDCIVSSWSDWSICSVSCGVGEITRTREILIQPQNGGRRCPRKLVKKKPCRLAPC